MRTLITASRLISGDGVLEDPALLVEDGRILSIASRETAALPAHRRRHDFPGHTLAPAFFDVHVHGAAGHDLMEATPEAVDAIGRFLATRGVGAYLATTVTAPLEATLRALDALGRRVLAAPRPGLAQPLGIHLEGPFLSHAKRGVHPVAHLLAPSIPVFERLCEAAQGTVRLMTVAPETDGAAELIAHAAARGVRVSLGHSNADSTEARRGLAAGAVSSTHTFNAMRGLDHRDPGILGLALTEDRLYAEMIADGIHVDPALVRLWFRAKGPDRCLLVTDGTSATGMPDGEYRLGGLAVEVREGKCLAGGTLAGSVLTMDRAVANFLAFTGAETAVAIRAASRNPAQMTGLAGEVGLLAAGRRADIAVLEPDGTLAAALLAGEPAG